MKVARNFTHTQIRRQALHVLRDGTHSAQKFPFRNYKHDVLPTTTWNGYSSGLATVVEGGQFSVKKCLLFRKHSRTKEDYYGCLYGKIVTGTQIWLKLHLQIGVQIL